MGVKEYFIEIGREEGREIGREIGREEGREIGIQEGRKIGRKQVRERFVKNLLADGHCTHIEIADLVGVSEAYVRKIKRTLKP